MELDAVRSHAESRDESEKPKRFWGGGDLAAGKGRLLFTVYSKLVLEK